MKLAHHTKRRILVILAQVYLWTLTSSITNRVFGSQRTQRGQGLVEYALVIAVVAVVAIVGLTFLGKNLSQTFSNIVENLNLPATGD